MATVTFAGSTLWDDSGTGVGRPYAAERGRQAVLVFEPVTRGVGQIVKNLGTIPESFDLFVRYRVSGSQLSGLRSTLNGVVGSTGTLAWPPSQSFSNCILAGSQRIRTEVVGITEGGSVVYEVIQSLYFERLT